MSWLKYFFKLNVYPKNSKANIMGHYMIDLPEHRRADVRWGTVFKKSVSFFHGAKSDSKRGYIVRVNEPDDNTEYRLFKALDGKWSADAEGKEALDDQTLMLIRNLIIQKEAELTSL